MDKLEVCDTMIFIFIFQMVAGMATIAESTPIIQGLYSKFHVPISPFDNFRTFFSFIFLKEDVCSSLYSQVTFLLPNQYGSSFLDLQNLVIPDIDFNQFWQPYTQVKVRSISQPLTLINIQKVLTDVPGGYDFYLHSSNVKVWWRVNITVMELFSGI